MTVAQAEVLPNIGAYAVPAGWDIATIGELFSIQQGKALSAAARTASSRFPFLRTANVLWGNLDLTKVDRMGLSDVERAKLRLARGDLLVCEGGEIGRAAIWDGSIEECYFQNHIHRLRPLREDVSPSFYAYWLQLAFTRLGVYEGAGTKTTIANLSRGRLANLLVPVPPLEEQRRIARILSTIDQARLATENLLAQARGVRRSCFQDLFAAAADWPAARLGDLARTSSGGTPRRDAIGLYGGSIPWVKSGEVRDNTIVETEENITDEGLANSSAKLFPAGTLIMAMYGATAAQVGILGIPAATNQAVCAIFPSDRASTAFLFFALQEARERLRAERYGGAQPNLSQQTIRNFEVPIPPADVQAQIVQVLTSVDRYIGAVSNHARALTAVFQSALSHLLADKVA